MNQLDKEEDGELGFNAQGGDPGPEPESKRIKLQYDVDDPNIQHVKENQVDDDSRQATKGAMSDTSTHEQPSKTKFEHDPYSLCFGPFGTDTEDYPEDNKDKMSAVEAVWLHYRQEWDEELAKRGIDVEKLKKKADWKGKCVVCGDVDMHPSHECPYGEFCYY